NHQLTAADFPLTRLAVPGVRGALDPATDSNDVISSQGVPFLTPGVLDPQGFNIGYINTRRVEPRNTPSVFNAVFNHRQFWDGRANDTFNGVNSVGDRDPSAMLARGVEPRVAGAVADREHVRDGQARPRRRRPRRPPPRQASARRTAGPPPR